MRPTPIRMQIFDKLAADQARLEDIINACDGTIWIANSKSLPMRYACPIGMTDVTKLSVVKNAAWRYAVIAIQSRHAVTGRTHQPSGCRISRRGWNDSCTIIPELWSP